MEAAMVDDINAQETKRAPVAIALPFPLTST